MARRSLALVILLAGVSSLVVARKREKDPVFNQINSIVQTLSGISGLEEQYAVPYGSISKKQLRHFLAKRIKKTLKPDEIRADELALKMFGLVPADFDLKKSTVDLLTEQAAAFYDYDEKKLFLLQGAALNEETTTLAHELAHALADQHFDLERYVDENAENDDENLACTAVVEGQASWLMVAYNLAAAGKTPIPSADMLREVEDTDDTSASDFPVLKASPLYIQQSLLFPYTDGTKFFDAAFRKLGKRAFSAVFTNPPVSSAQILHPERYFARQKPTVPDLPKLDLGGADNEVTEGSVGEFDEQILLWQYAGRARANELAQHLLGAQFRVTVAGKHGQPVLEYVSQWDSNRTAAAYFTAYKKVLAGKWKKCAVSLNSATVFAGTGDDGYFVTHLTGDKLVSVEGLSDAATWASLKASARPRREALKISRGGTGKLG